MAADPPPPAPPPAGAWPPGADDQPTDQRGWVKRNPVPFAMLLVAGVLLAILAAGVLAAIVVPAFLNQRDLARQAELTSAVRNAAVEVEPAATAHGGSYSAIPDLTGLVEVTLAADTDGRVLLDTDSLLTYAQPDDFGICAEHIELAGSVAYVSSEGGLLDYRDVPCP